MTPSAILVVSDIDADRASLERHAGCLTKTDLAELAGQPPPPDIAGAHARSSAPPQRVREERQDVRRAARIVLRIIMRSVFADAAAAPLRRRQGGQPFLENFSGAVSIAHSARHLALAVSPVAPIGVDLEAIRQRNWPSARAAQLIGSVRALSDLRAIEGLGPNALDDPANPSALIRAWTIAEAIAKARGDGIGAVLADIGVMAASERADGDLAWHRDLSIRCLDVQGCAVAVAVPRGISVVRKSVPALTETSVRPSN